MKAKILAVTWRPFCWPTTEGRSTETRGVGARLQGRAYSEFLSGYMHYRGESRRRPRFVPQGPGTGRTSRRSF